MAWQDLDHYWDYEGQNMTLRGFIYQTEEGRSILATEPHLKSCCIGNPSLSKPQVELIGHLPNHSSNRAETVQGRLIVTPASATAFQLHDVTLIEPQAEKGICGVCLATVFLLVAVVLAIVWHAVRKAQNKRI